MHLGRFDELGSGILNINKYCKAYSGHHHPEFIEGAVFRTIVPLDEGLNEGLNEGLKTLLNSISIYEGIQSKELSYKLDRPIKTIERQIRELVQRNIIERKGSKKTGGYFIIQQLKN